MLVITAGSASTSRAAFATGLARFEIGNYSLSNPMNDRRERSDRAFRLGGRYRLGGVLVLVRGLLQDTPRRAQGRGAAGRSRQTDRPLRLPLPGELDLLRGDEDAAREYLTKAERGLTEIDEEYWIDHARALLAKIGSPGS